MITRAHASTLLAAGFAAAALPLRAQTAAAIRIACVLTDGSSAPYYAKDMGFFAKAGLDAEIQGMQSASAIAAAVTGGAVDIGFSAIDVLAGVHQKGVPVVVVAPASEYVSPAMLRSAAIVVPASSTAQSAKDLNGKVVASNGLHSFGEVAARAWIDHNGGDSSSCKYVEMPFPTMPAALAAGRIDAAFTVEPFLTAARKEGRVLGYGYDSIAKHFVIGAWFTTASWAKDHADVVRRFAGAMHDTAVWANANPSQSGEILAKYLKLDPSAVATMVRSHYAEQLSAALMQPLIDASAKYNGYTAFPAAELLYQPGRS